MAAAAMSAGRRYLPFMQISSWSFLAIACAVALAAPSPIHPSNTGGKLEFLEWPGDYVGLLQQDLAVVRKRYRADQANTASPLNQEEGTSQHQAPQEHPRPLGETVLTLMATLHGARLASGGEVVAVIILILIIIVLCALAGILAFRNSEPAVDGLKEGASLSNDDATRAQGPQQRSRRHPSSARSSSTPMVASKNCCMGFLPGSKVSSARAPSVHGQDVTAMSDTGRSSTVGTFTPPFASTAPSKGVRFAGRDEIVHFAADGRPS